MVVLDKSYCCGDQKKPKCDKCPNRCTVPGLIDLSSIDKDLFYDLACHSTYSPFQNPDFVQNYNGGKVDFDSKKCRGNMMVKYKACDGGPSPGFVVVLKTAPCERYTLNVTGVLTAGDQAFIQIESLYPPGKLVSKENTLTSNLLKSMDISFQAASEFTVVGIFFFCETKDYNLKVCDFTVKACQVCNPCPIICEPWEKCGKKCKPNSFPCDPCGPGMPFGPKFKHGFPCPPFFPPFGSSPCSSSCIPCKRKKCKESGGIEFITINYCGISIKKLTDTQCLSSDPDFYILETNGCQKGQCKLWVCNVDTGQLEEVIPSEDPFFFLDKFQCRIFKGKSTSSGAFTCREIIGCIGDKIWDLGTGTIYKYTRKGWKEIGQVNETLSQEQIDIIEV